MARRRSSHNGRNRLTPDAPSTGSPSTDRDDDEADPLRELADNAAEFRIHIQTLTQAVLDQTVEGARSRLHQLILLTARTVIAIAIVIVGAVFVLHGTALALTTPYGPTQGYLLTGILAIIAVVLSAWVLHTYDRWRRRIHLEQKYANRKTRMEPDGEAVDDLHV